MIVLDVLLNDRKLCRAGVGKDGVLNAIASWVKLSGPALAEAHALEELVCPLAGRSPREARQSHRCHDVPVGAEAGDEVEGLEHDAHGVPAVGGQLAPRQA